MTHICISKLAIIVSDNVLSPDWCQAIIWNSAGILSVGPLSEISFKIHKFTIKTMHLKMPSGKWWAFYIQHQKPNIAQACPYWQVVHDKTGTNFITTLLCLYTVCSPNTHAAHWCVVRTGNSVSMFVPSSTRSHLFYHLLYIPGNMQMALFCLTFFVVVVVLYHSFLCTWVINLPILFRVVSVVLEQS